MTVQNPILLCHINNKIKEETIMLSLVVNV